MIYCQGTRSSLLVVSICDLRHGRSQDQSSRQDCSLENHTKTWVSEDRYQKHIYILSFSNKLPNTNPNPNSRLYRKKCHLISLNADSINLRKSKGKNFCIQLKYSCFWKQPRKYVTQEVTHNHNPHSKNYLLSQQQHRAILPTSISIFFLRGKHKI